MENNRRLWQLQKCLSRQAGFFVYPINTPFNFKLPAAYSTGSAKSSTEEKRSIEGFDADIMELPMNAKITKEGSTVERNMFAVAYLCE